MKTIIIRLLSILLFAIMLLFPADTLSGASAGLLLWFQTVLPTLLPCMILADFLLRIRADRYLTRLLSRPLSALLGVSRDGAYAVLVGFLCGYPMGAKTTASLLAEARISRREASYLLSFCNQPSPMFLIGYLCLSLLANDAGTHSLIAPVLAGVYGSAIFVSFLYRALRQMHRQLTQQPDDRIQRELPHHGSGISSAASGHADNLRAVLSANAGKPAQKTAGSSPLSLLEASMMTSFEVMVKIGGYMILFSVLEVFLSKLPLSSPAVKYTLMGFVEMTTGSRQIASAFALPWSAALCCGVTAFGGLSGFAQTANVLKDSGLSTGRYFLWKLMQGTLAAAIVILGVFFWRTA